MIKQMIKLINETFKITNDSIIVAIPLITFLLIFSAYTGYAQIGAKTLPGVVIALTTIFLMFCAFSSGWFYMVKKAIKLAKKEFIMDEDRTKAVMTLFRQIPSGIGKYFVPFVFYTILMIIFWFICTSLLGIIGLHTIGNPDIDASVLRNFGSTVADHREFLNSLTESQLVTLFNWELLMYLGVSLLLYIEFLWVPEIIYGTKNAFMAFIKSVKKVFKKPLKTFVVFIFFGTIHLVSSILSIFSQIHPILYIAIFVLKFYLMIYSIILVFNYYENEFIED